MWFSKSGVQNIRKEDTIWDNAGLELQEGKDR
jgi:hypothetical protein